MPKENVKAFLCDFDGTLVDSEELHIKSWGIFAKEAAIKDDIDFTVFIGTSDKYVAECLINDYNIPYKIEEIVAGKMKHFSALVKENLLAYPTVLETLSEIDELGVPIVVVTSSSRAYLEEALDITGIGKYIHAYVCLDDVKNRKPSPEPFSKAHALLGLNASDCIALEDSIAGIQSSKAAGIYSVAITNSFAESDLIEADAIINEFSDIKKHALFTPHENIEN